MSEEPRMAAKTPRWSFQLAWSWLPPGTTTTATTTATAARQGAFLAQARLDGRVFQPRWRSRRHRGGIGQPIQRSHPFVRLGDANLTGLRLRQDMHPQEEDQLRPHLLAPAALEQQANHRDVLKDRDAAGGEPVLAAEQAADGQDFPILEGQGAGHVADGDDRVADELVLHRSRGGE